MIAKSNGIAEIGARKATGVIKLTLPLPPTINHYYGIHGKRRFIRPAGIQYRKKVADIVSDLGCKTLEGRLSVFVAIWPSNRIRQDLDNRLKALQDSLTHAGVWLDDSQIDELHLVRREVIKGGKVEVVIVEKEIA